MWQRKELTFGTGISEHQATCSDHRAKPGLEPLGAEGDVNIMPASKEVPEK